MEASNALQLGDWNIPLSGGTIKKLREGRPFWEYLGDAGIPTTVVRMPGDFPATGKRTRSVSGMGTPDILGSYGTFSFFTSSPSDNDKDVSGGNIFPLDIKDNKVMGELLGPVNSLRKGKPNIKIPFVVWRDPKNGVAKLTLQNHELIMKAGEWSDWVQLSFDLVPHLKSEKGICKFYIKQIHPHFQMYVSPINIDPSDSVLPVTSPAGLGEELVQNVGLFGTKGLPADTKALSYGILSEDEYIEMSRQIFDESKHLMQYELKRLNLQQCGVFFSYFSNLDQDSHMFWRALDKDHPLYTPTLYQRYHHVIRDLYIEMDTVLGEVYQTFDITDKNFSLIVMSDHGFAPFYRSVNLNTWLLNNAYISFIGGRSSGPGTFFENVDWSKTRAYGLGINALYVNKRGRERYGTVSQDEYWPLMTRLKADLLELKDPLSGMNAVSNVWIGKEIYNRDDDKVPDLIVGWNKGFRASWETILGGFTQEVFVDNDDKWSGDHCIDRMHVPAVLMSNKKIKIQKPTLPDVTATILAECNIPIPEQMTGNPVY